MEIYEKIAAILSSVRKERPLIHHLTNYVTANDCANIVLALGGSPVMADDVGEVEEMVTHAASLVLNIGTLNKGKMEAMLLAGKEANKRRIPVILDPVGVGATAYRTEAVEKLLQEVKPAVIRGNRAEIKRLLGLNSRLRGVDSLEEAENSPELVLNLAQRLGCVVAMTGERDVISDGKRLCFIENGHPMLTRITGSGCMSTSLIGTCCGVANDYYLGAVAGVAIMGLAGEMAYMSLSGTEGVGTFRVRLLDSIYNLTEKRIIEGVRISPLAP
ncbi:hydroxyethylthiazole kinase [Zhaonella formicivorans]|uniref:hydroxyethylthiazole kinase n=1 Tax=Zhaonella formicivorans TaxID=2528593 RepID=UPI0010F2EB11|nr:hydroxyethylthiazole kinase [Zhaonella formicivorans]